MYIKDLKLEITSTPQDLRALASMAWLKTTAQSMTRLDKGTLVTKKYGGGTYIISDTICNHALIYRVTFDMQRNRWLNTGESEVVSFDLLKKADPEVMRTAGPSVACLFSSLARARMEM